MFTGNYVMELKKLPFCFVTKFTFYVRKGFGMNMFNHSFDATSITNDKLFRIFFSCKMRKKTFSNLEINFQMKFILTKPRFPFTLDKPFTRWWIERILNFVIKNIESTRKVLFHVVRTPLNRIIRCSFNFLSNNSWVFPCNWIFRALYFVCVQERWGEVDVKRSEKVFDKMIE